MGKFCGECGSELKNNKCPKCDKKETKKVVKKEEPKNEKVNSFGWGTLGFCFPIVGLILFLVFLNKKKGISKASGIGALISVAVDLITVIAFFVCMPIAVRRVSNYVMCGNSDACRPSIDFPDVWEDDEDEDEDDINTVYISNINTKEPLLKKDFVIEETKSILENIVYDLDNKDLKVLLKNKSLTITNNEGVILVYLNDIAYAEYTEFDCSGWDIIYAVGPTKQYYIDLNKHVASEIKAVEINKYLGYKTTVNHTYTCGGSHILLGIDSQNNYYDLNGETIINFDSIYYYDDANNWINSTTRGYKLAGNYGTVKGIINASESDVLLGIIDVDGKAYKYVYDNGKSSLTQIVTDEISTSNTVVKVDDNMNNNTVTLTFDNGETYTIDYAMLDY